MTPGIHRITAKEYHADPCPEPSLSATLAKLIVTQSPLHAFACSPRLNPYVEKKESASFDLGSAAHALLLEGEDRMAIIDAADYRTKAAKEARDQARAAGMHPVLRHRYDDVRRMRDVALESIERCEDLRGIRLEDGAAEQTLIWREGETWCRARLDWMHADRRLILDYKSTDTNAHPEAWVRTMTGQGGEVQGAFYLRGNRALGGPESARFVFIVQEVTPPFACSFVGLPPSFIALGDSKVELAVATWRRCLATGQWPGYPARICWVDPPAWHQAQWEERMDPMPGIPYAIEKLWRKPSESELDRAFNDLPE